MLSQKPVAMPTIPRTREAASTVKGVSGGVGKGSLFRIPEL